MMIPKYFKLTLQTAASSLLLFFATGCETTNTGARYIESSGPETIVSLNQINIQDWMNAADQMVNSLLDSGVLERSPQQPAVLGISRIVNDTQQRVDIDALTKKIRVALSKTGKVQTTTTMGLGGKAEDPLAQSAAQYQAFMNDEKASVLIPTYSLSGKLLEDRVAAGKDRQVTYTFQLSLTEISSGLAVWEDEVLISKAGRKASVGW